MGLDSYFVHTRETDKGPESKPLNPDPRLENLRLCGGMMSGHGNDGSFRGKVYADLIEAVTNNECSLYEEAQSGESLVQMRDGLREWLRKFSECEGHTDQYGLITTQEIRDLETLFTVAIEQDATLVGWW